VSLSIQARIWRFLLKRIFKERHLLLAESRKRDIRNARFIKQFPHGAEVKRIDIEGIPADHPLKRAWVAEQVPQCGYCQPGQIMHAFALLSENPEPSEAEIAKVMERIFCRCGSYVRIEKAIRRAAAELRAPREVRS